MNARPGPTEGKTIYRYGWLGWVWRILIAGAQGLGWFLVYTGFLHAQFWFYLIAAPLILPGWYFGHVVASRVDLHDYGELVVTTLMGKHRRLTRDDLGKPRLFFQAQATVGYVFAPRAWIPVRNKWPIYLDLYGQITDRKSFIAVFGIDKKHVPRQATEQR